MLQERYQTIDDILGDREKRFFSNGFRNVSYSLKNIKITSGSTEINAVGSVFYPDNWSVKKDGTQLKPHLSTLDVLLLSLYVNILHINTTYCLTKSQQAQTWVKSLKIKAGSEAYFDMSQVKIKSKATCMENADSYLGDYTSKYINNIEGFKVEIEFDHTINKKDENDKYITDMNEVFGNLKNDYYSLLYRFTNYDISKTDFDMENKTITSLISIENSCKDFVKEGTSSYYYPYYSMIDTFVCSAQQMQALIYYLDGIDRKCSNNLWMRKVCMKYKKPFRNIDGFKQTVKINKTTIINVNGHKWRMADFECGIDHPDSPFSLCVSLTHQLPD